MENDINLEQEEQALRRDIYERLDSPEEDFESNM